MDFLVATLTGALIIATATLLRRGSDWMKDFTQAACFASYPILLAMMTLTTEYLFRPPRNQFVLYRAVSAAGSTQGTGPLRFLTFYGCTLFAAALVAIAGFRQHRGIDALVTAVFAFYPFGLGYFMSFGEGLRYHTVDASLYRLDRALHLDPFPWIHYVYSRPLLFQFLLAVYAILPIFIALGWVIDRSTTLLRAAVIAPILAGSVLYNLVPGVGPIHGFTPTIPHQLLPFDAVANLPRNAFPSMHLTWALLIALNAKHPAWRPVAWTFVLLTAFSTLGTGEHYSVDLVAAVPFALGVQWLARVAGAISLGRRPVAAVAQ
jgi:hypothetical protein